MSEWLGHFNTDGSNSIVSKLFSTHDAAGANVAPSSAFENADIRIYKAATDTATSATQRSSTDGITMTSPFDSLIGFHLVSIDLTSDDHAGFYVDGHYWIVLAPDETIDGETITGVVLARFSIGVPVANVTQFGGTNGTFASGVPAVNASHWGGEAVATTFNSGVPLVDLAYVQGNGVSGSLLGNLEQVFVTDFAAAYDGTNDRWTVGVEAIANDVITADSLNADAVAQIRDAIVAEFVDDLGTAQAGGASTITLRSGASDQDNAYQYSAVKTTGGTGAGQTRQIASYVGSTRVANVDDAWTVQPDNTTTYLVLGRIV